MPIVQDQSRVTPGEIESIQYSSISWKAIFAGVFIL